MKERAAKETAQKLNRPQTENSLQMTLIHLPLPHLLKHFSWALHQQYIAS